MTHAQPAPAPDAPTVAAVVVLAAGLALLALGSRAPRDPGPFAVEA